MALAAFVAYFVAFVVTEVFVRILRKKHKRQENCFFYYDLSVEYSISKTLPFIMMFMFVIGEIIVIVLQQ